MIQIKGTNYQVTGDIRAYIDKKIGALGKFADVRDPLTRFDIECARLSEHHKGGKVFRMEATVTIGGKQFRASAEEETMTAAIDAVQEELMKEMSRDKRKETSLVRRTGARVKEMMRDWRNWKF